MNLKRNIPLLYAFNFLYGLMFFLPIFALLLEAKLESLFLITLLLASQAILIVVFEIPSGAFSDKFGRRVTIMLAGGIMVLALPFLYFGNSFLPLFVYVFFNSLGRSFWSGTDSSLLYESDPKNFKKIMGFHSSLWSLGAAVGSFIGGFMAVQSLTLPVAITLIPFGIGFILTFFLIEPRRHKVEETLFGHMTKAMKHISSHVILLLLMVVGLLFFASGEVAHQLNSLFFTEKGISLSLFGILSVLIFGSSFVGFTLSAKISRYVGNKQTLFLTAVGPFVLLLLAARSEGLIAGLIVGVMSFFWGLRQPILMHYYHKLAPSNQRATVISMLNFANQLGYAVIALLVGYVGGFVTLTFLYFCVAFLYIPVAILLTQLKLDQ